MTTRIGSLPENTGTDPGDWLSDETWPSVCYTGYCAASETAFDRVKELLGEQLQPMSGGVEEHIFDDRNVIAARRWNGKNPFQRCFFEMTSSGGTGIL